MKNILKEDMDLKILLFDRYVPSALTYISILKENNLFPINGMQPIETIFEEVVEILEDYRANKDKGKKVEYDPEI